MIEFMIIVVPVVKMIEFIITVVIKIIKNINTMIAKTVIIK